MQQSKILKISLSNYGDSLHRNSGCFEVKHRNGKIETYPHFRKEIGECVFHSGSYTSVDSLIDLALFNIDTYFLTRRNRVVAVLRSVEEDNRIETLVPQVNALTNGKGIEIAKQLVISKIEGQNRVLIKYGLKFFNMDEIKNDVKNIHFSDLKPYRRRLIQIEGKCSKIYFKQIFSLFPEKIRPEYRETWKAYDGINNVFNFGYYVLKCRIYKALLKAHLEPFLGFLHTIKSGNPSLVSDFQEPYRYLIDDFLIERCKKYHKNDFVLVTDFMMKLRMGKKIHLRV